MNTRLLQPALAVGLVVLAACTPATPSTPAVTSVPPAATAAPAKPAAAPTPATGAAAASTPAAAGAPASKPATGEPVKIGLSAAFTGPTAYLGQSAQNAVQMAVDAYNAQGGMKGRPIQIVTEDNQNQPSVAVN
jgi:branched-chain amino acid transport system substrate-binding protein